MRRRRCWTRAAHTSVTSNADALAVALQQLAIAEAQAGVLQVQLQVVKQHLALLAAPTVVVPAPAAPGPAATEPAVDDRPAGCRDVDRDLCGLVSDDEDARYPIGNFADPLAWKCRSCSYRSDHPEG